MARMAKAIETVEEILTLSKGKRPVRINQIASNIIPKFLPAKLFVSAMELSFCFSTNLLRARYSRIVQN